RAGQRDPGQVVRVLMALVDRLGQLRPAAPEHGRRSRVAEHLREGGPPHAGAHDHRAHVGAALRDGPSPGGSVPESAGPARPPEERAWSPAGSACPPRGSARPPAGSACPPRGSARPPAGTAWLSGGPAWPSLSALARRAVAGSNGTAGGSLPRS